MTEIFDGLADIFTDTAIFGEELVYVIDETSEEKTIDGIWNESPILAGDAPQADGTRILVSVREADIAAPAENDLVTRSKTGVQGVVVPPIQHDDVGGLWVLMLERQET